MNTNKTIEPVHYEWAKARMIYHRDAAEAFKEERDALLVKNAKLWEWLKLSVACFVTLLGFYIFLYIKTH